MPRPWVRRGLLQQAVLDTRCLVRGQADEHHHLHRLGFKRLGLVARLVRLLGNPRNLDRSAGSIARPATQTLYLHVANGVSARF